LWLIVGVCGVAVMGLMLIVGLQPRSVVESVGRSETSSPPTAASPQSWSTPVSIEPPRPAPTPVSPAAAIDPSRVYTGREVSEKARLLSKPEPSYTETARQNRVWGTVVLKVVFSASGSVENISVVSGLPDGLTESAIDAARKIRFIPAKKDGVPVSMWMQLEYNFNLY
jgi:TonB family protein